MLYEALTSALELLGKLPPSDEARRSKLLQLILAGFAVLGLAVGTVAVRGVVLVGS